MNLSTVDFHTAGEPFRIVRDGSPELPGSTVIERREAALTSPDVQRLRKLLCHEPRGHADMYGGFITPADDDGGDFGVVFWHRDGFSTACGHGTIASGVWAIEEGIVDAKADGVTAVTFDVPSGRVEAKVRCEGGIPQSAVFRNVPSYVLARKVPVEVGGRSISLDLAFSGAIYASVPASAVGLAVVPADLRQLISVAAEIKRELRDHPVAHHPTDERLSGIYGVIFHSPLEELPEGPRQRNVAVFADGEVDRSPCGSGTSARLALLHEQGDLPLGTTLLHESIIGTRFRAVVTENVAIESRRAVVTEVEGMAYRTGEHRFTLDPRDPLDQGFLLR
jgi:proline racemase